MEDICAERLIKHLSKCRHIINRGYNNIQTTRLPWLNSFCLEFFKLSQELQKFLALVNDRQFKGAHVEVAYLCLTQIVTCIKCMERTIKAEEAQGTAISASRQHFLDRIHWCMDRLSSCIKSIETSDVTIPEESTFVDLMDVALDQLSPYTSYKDERSSEMDRENVNVAEEQAEAMFVSQQIRSTVDLILSHTLAFANVALKQDKKALSALCQKVLRECMAFQEECGLGASKSGSGGDSYRKLKGISLENALYQLEDYINEALLRLVFTCFLDYNKLSLEKLRTVIKEKDVDDPELDELIADFDVNIDRTTQIGMFAIAFAPNVKIKTIVRSCLASFESLDSCIIPSLQLQEQPYFLLLEQHYNDEVSNFKQAIQEIIDSQAFTSCYYELMTQAINSNDKKYNKQSLMDLIQMGNFLYDHFQMAVNQKELRSGNRMELFKKFTLMLHECQAVLKCSDTEQVQTDRVLKRFRILRSILKKLIDELGGTSANGNPSPVFLMSDELSDSQRMFASIGISPSIRSILYSNSLNTERKRRHLASDSLKANYSKLPLLTPPSQKNEPLDIRGSMKVLRCTGNNIPGPQVKRCSIRRKESLRTAMFKRQKTGEIEEIDHKQRNSSSSLQISEILDQLTSMSSNFSEDTLDKSIISK